MQPEAAEDRMMPALWTYVAKVYRQMEDEAEVERLAGDLQGEEEEATGLVYTGHLTSLFQGMGIPNPYYTSVTRALKLMGCVIQLRRGGGTARSKWLLVAPPSEESFMDADAGSKTARAHKGKVAILEQRVRDLTKRVVALEDLISQSQAA